MDGPPPSNIEAMRAALNSGWVTSTMGQSPVRNSADGGVEAAECVIAALKDYDTRLSIDLDIPRFDRANHPRLYDPAEVSQFVYTLARSVSLDYKPPGAIRGAAGSDGAKVKVLFLDDKAASAAQVTTTNISFFRVPLRVPFTRSPVSHVSATVKSCMPLGRV